MTEEVEINKNVLDHLIKARKNRNTLQVLVVEDDDFSRTLLKRSLKQYETIEAADGVNALKEYALNAPDLVFLDIELPDLQGHDILQQIIDADSEAFVVMLTSHQEKSYVEKAITIGAKGYIVKPFSKDRIDYYLDKCSSQKNS